MKEILGKLVMILSISLLPVVIGVRFIIFEGSRIGGIFLIVIGVCVAFCVYDDEKNTEKNRKDVIKDVIKNVIKDVQ